MNSYHALVLVERIYKFIELVKSEKLRMVITIRNWKS